jgi:hypothetical protein
MTSHSCNIYFRSSCSTSIYKVTLTFGCRDQLFLYLEESTISIILVIEY